jgi:pimeloyl-ACP methyl ester carboxylesterase
MKTIFLHGFKPPLQLKKLGCMVIFILSFVAPTLAQDTNEAPLEPGLRLSTFDVDATPPVGSPLAYDSTANAWDLGLRAKGIILMGAGQPIVLCAVDWIGIANESQDVFKSALADAAGTVPDRVAVHTLHQHDAPISDFGAEKILLEAGLDPAGFEGSFDRVLIGRLQNAIKVAITQTEPVTHIGLGKAEVFEVASNRRILGHDGKAIFSRTSATKDSAMRAEPEGLIDPMVQLVSFWNQDEPLSVMSYYAVHPQSYYLTKVANPDFPGVARFFRQLALPDALQVHFNGAGANITAGKYNDGSHENRLILAERLADGMERAWESTQKHPINSKDVFWEVEEVALLPKENLSEIEKQMKTEGYRFLTNNMIKLAWMKRANEGKRIGVSCLTLGPARILHLPGELFVEYQLAAKAERPDLFVAMAAYGDYGPFYIGPATAYGEGGYEITVSPVTPQAEPLLMGAIRKLLNKEDLTDASRKSEGVSPDVNNPESWEKKRMEVLVNMEKVMGKLPQRAKLPPFDLQVMDIHEEENYTRQNIIFTVAENENLPAYLYLPKYNGHPKKLPAMLVLHGTGELGKQLVDGKSPLSNRALAKELANRGYVVIAPDYPSMGDLREYDFGNDRYESGTMKAIFNHMRSLDLLQGMPEVDPDRIGVIGHSLGGHNAIFVGAFDPRLKVVVSSCGWTPFEYYNIGEEASKKYGGKLGPWAQDRYMPLIREKYKLEADQIPFDFPDIIASLAPRAFFSNSPVNDSNFDFLGVKKGMEKAKSVFKQLGAADRIQVQYPLAGHDFPLEVRKDAYEFIDDILQHTPQNTELR